MFISGNRAERGWVTRKEKWIPFSIGSDPFNLYYGIVRRVLQFINKQ